MGDWYAIAAINQACLGHCHDQCSLQHPERCVRDNDSTLLHLLICLNSVGVLSLLLAAKISCCFFGQPSRVRLGYNIGNRDASLLAASEP
jgi:hypothetical protein